MHLELSCTDVNIHSVWFFLFGKASRVSILEYARAFSFVTENKGQLITRVPEIEDEW